MFWIPMMAMAAAAAIQGAQKENAERKSRQNKALVNRYAPIFHQPVEAAEPIQNHILPDMLAGAIRGYEFGSRFDMDDALREAAKQQMVTPASSGQTYGLDLPKMRSVFDPPESLALGSGNVYGMNLPEMRSVFDPPESIALGSGNVYGMNLPGMRSVFNTGGYGPSFSPGGRYNL